MPKAEWQEQELATLGTRPVTGRAKVTVPEWHLGYLQETPSHASFRTKALGYAPSSHLIFLFITKYIGKSIYLDWAFRTNQYYPS